MNLFALWGGILAYFCIFWVAVEDFALAVICTFLLVLIGLRYTIATIMAREADRRFQRDRMMREEQHPPEVANWNQPVRRGSR